MRVWLVLALAFAKERPVSKVIKLLQNMQAELEHDAEKDQAIYERLSCWCETNTKEKGASITAAGNAISQGVADTEKNSAKAAQLSTEIKQVENEIATNEAGLAQATQVRESEYAESTQEQKDLALSIQALENALGVLGKHHSFLQTDAQTDTSFTEVKMAVKKVLALPKGLPAHKRVLQRFLQGPANAALSSMKQVLNQMKQEFEANLSSEQSDEAQSEHDYEQLKVAKTREIAAGKQQGKAKRAQFADAKVALAQAKEDVADSREKRAADVQFSQDLALQCDAKDNDYAIRTKTRSQETAAISETITILNDDEAHDSFSATLGFIQKHAAHGMVHKVAQTAEGPDVFAKVRKSIDQMVAGLEEEGADDTKGRDACVGELNANEKALALKQREIDELTTDIAKATEAIAALKKQIAAHAAEVKETKKQMQQATQDREAENKEFQDTVREMRATQAVLAKALARLKEFYGFVQEDDTEVEKPNAPAEFDTYKNNAGAGGVIRLLKNVSEEARQMELESIKSEQDSQAAYEGFVKDANASISDLTASIARKSGEKAEQEAAKVGAEADRGTSLKDAENLQATAADLHASCDFLLQNYDARRAAREQEVEALADAKAIFSGSDFA